MARVRVHWDVSKAGFVLAQAYCGMMGARTTTARSEVTCKLCLARLRREEQPAQPKQRAGQLVSREELASAAQEAARRALSAIPSAGPPPRLDPLLWAQSCKGGQGECDPDTCPLCSWEREANLWDYANTGRKRERSRRAEGAPRWPSLAAAICALLEWEQHNRWGPSSMGPILTRIEAGFVDGGAGQKEDPVMRRASEMVRVRQALDGAFPDGSHPALTHAQCVGVLLARTAGALGALAGAKERQAGLVQPVRSYEELSAQLGVSVGSLRSLVKRGRVFVTVELAARGLVPMPRPALGLHEKIERERHRLAPAGS